MFVCGTAKKVEYFHVFPHFYFDASSSKFTPTDVCSTDTEPDSDTDHIHAKHYFHILF